jgi:hypothetical protein
MTHYQFLQNLQTDFPFENGDPIKIHFDMKKKKAVSRDASR